MKLKKDLIKKYIYQPRLTRQTRDLGYEMEIESKTKKIIKLNFQLIWC
jgi:hypothetical protein